MYRYCKKYQFIPLPGVILSSKHHTHIGVESILEIITAEAPVQEAKKIENRLHYLVTK